MKRKTNETSSSIIIGDRLLSVHDVLNGWANNFLNWRRSPLRKRRRFERDQNNVDFSVSLSIHGRFSPDSLAYLVTKFIYSNYCRAARRMRNDEVMNE